MKPAAPYVILSKPKLADGPRATVDFETRSVADVRRVGSWLYSRHASTQALCFAYKLPDWKEPKLWHRAHPALGIKESDAPEELFSWIAFGGLVEAHNAMFERNIWANVMRGQHAWPEVPEDLWRCSAAKAAAHALPRSLEGAIEALKLPVKKDSAVGKAFINRYCKPRKLSKEERELFDRVRRVQRRRGRARERLGILPPRRVGRRSVEP
jgi:DNA polymerase